MVLERRNREAGGSGRNTCVRRKFPRSGGGSCVLPFPLHLLSCPLIPLGRNEERFQKRSVEREILGKTMRKLCIQRKGGGLVGPEEQQGDKNPAFSLSKSFFPRKEICLPALFKPTLKSPPRDYARKKRREHQRAQKTDGTKRGKK